MDKKPPVPANLNVRRLVHMFIKKQKKSNLRLQNYRYLQICMQDMSSFHSGGVGPLLKPPADYEHLLAYNTKTQTLLRVSDVIFWGDRSKTSSVCLNSS